MNQHHVIYSSGQMLTSVKRKGLHALNHFQPLHPCPFLFTEKESPAKAFCQLQKTLLFFYEYLNTLLHILINEDRETVQYGHTFIWLHKLRHLVVEYSQLTDLGFISQMFRLYKVSPDCVQSAVPCLSCRRWL